MILLDFNMFDIVNKSVVLQHKFKSMKDVRYDKDDTNLYTYYT